MVTNTSRHLDIGSMAGKEVVGPADLLDHVHLKSGQHDLHALVYTLIMELG